MSGRERRTDRKRLRANFKIVTKFDPERPPPDDDDYQSSDMEQDYADLAAAKEKSEGREGKAEIAEELRARRTRVIKKSDAIKLKLGKNLVGDAIYFMKVEALHISGNYRAALDHIEAQETRIEDDRLQEHGAADVGVYWDIVHKYMTKSYTMHYTEALAEDAKSELAQAPGEDVDAYVVRARSLQKAVKAFMKAGERTQREIDAFEVGFNKSWIDGLTHPGNLRIAHMAAVKKGIPMGFEEIRAEAAAVEQCSEQHTGGERGHTRRAPSNASAPRGQGGEEEHGQGHTHGAPANAAGPGEGRGHSRGRGAPADGEKTWGKGRYGGARGKIRGAPANAADAWREEELGYGQETGLEWAEGEEEDEEEGTTAMAAVAKLAEQVGKMQESLTEVGRRQGHGQDQRSKEGYSGQSGKGGKGGYGGQTGKGGKGAYQGQTGKGGKGGKGGYTHHGSPNGTGPHTAQGGGPATLSSQTWQTTPTGGGPPTPMPYSQAWQTAPMGGGPPPPMPYSQAWQTAPTGGGPPPPMPYTPETCRSCMRNGEDGNHEYKYCPDYIGCGICKGKGHYAKECTKPCQGCGQTSMIGRQRHQRGCPLLPSQWNSWARQ